MYRRSGRSLFLEPDDPRIAADFGQVALDGGTSTAEGRAVVVGLDEFAKRAK